MVKNINSSTPIVRTGTPPREKVSAAKPEAGKVGNLQNFPPEIIEKIGNNLSRKELSPLLHASRTFYNSLHKHNQDIVIEKGKDLSEALAIFSADKKKRTLTLKSNAFIQNPELKIERLSCDPKRIKISMLTDVNGENSQRDANLYDLIEFYNHDLIHFFLTEISSGENPIVLKEYINRKNEDGKTVLHQLAIQTTLSGGHEAMKMLMHLVLLGGDLNIQDDKGCTPVHHCYPGFVKWCFEHGGREDIKNNERCAPLKFSNTREREEQSQFVRSLDMKLNPEKLISSNEKDLLEKFPELKERKNDILKLSSNDAFETLANNRSLREAVKNKDYNRVKELLSLETAKPNPNVKARDGESIILHASVIEDSDICMELIKNGGDPNVKDSKGKSIIIYAIAGEKPKLIDFLIEKGADLSVVHKGNTLRDWIRKKCTPEKYDLSQCRNILDIINNPL